MELPTDLSAPQPSGSDSVVESQKSSMTRGRLALSAVWLSGFLLLMGLAALSAARTPSEAGGLAIVPVLFLSWAAVPFLGAAVGTLAARGWVGVAVTLGLWMVSCLYPATQSQLQARGPLPPAAEVRFIVVSAFNSGLSKPDIPPFLLPSESFAEFLAKLTPYDRLSSPTQTAPMGAAWIGTRDNQRTWIVEWYESGQNPLEFSINGVRYQKSTYEPSVESGWWPDEGLRMDTFVRKLHRDQHPASK